MKLVYTIHSHDDSHDDFNCNVRDRGLVDWTKLRLEDGSKMPSNAVEVIVPIPNNIIIPQWNNGKWDEYTPTSVQPMNKETTLFADFVEDGMLNGFYSTEVHSKIPETAVSITTEMWEYILNNQGKYRFDPLKILDKVDEIENTLAEVAAEHGLLELQQTSLYERISGLNHLISTLQAAMKAEPEERDEATESKETYDYTEEIIAIQAEMERLQKLGAEVAEKLQAINYPKVIDSQDFLVELPIIEVDPDTLPLSPDQIKERFQNQEATLDITMASACDLYEQNLRNEQTLDVTQMALVELYERVLTK